MNQLSFVGTYRTSPCILTEGAVVERLRREFHIPLDENLIHAALIYNDSYREVLAGIYKQYIDIATRHQLPLMLMTPTRRANTERISGSVYRQPGYIAGQRCLSFGTSRYSFYSRLYWWFGRLLGRCL